jgi:hypothetical protein
MREAQAMPVGVGAVGTEEARRDASQGLSYYLDGGCTGHGTLPHEMYN